MRNATLDWVPVPLWVECAGNVLRAGLAQFPESAYLNIQVSQDALHSVYSRRCCERSTRLVPALILGGEARK